MKTILCLTLFVVFWCCSSAQVITTIAGNGTPGFSGEGGPATSAELSFLVGVASDKWGNIYIADRGNSVVQKIDTNGILTRFAGSGISGYSGDGGLATSANLYFYLFAGIAVDTIGNVYIGCGGTVRKINTAGIISTVAGDDTYGYSGDGGPATAAQFGAITGICLDKIGNLYIADDQQSVIRMVNTSGIISTIAGTTMGFSGDGGPAIAAQLKTPDGITMDDTGNLYVCDGVSQRLRKINTSGIINSIAGGNPDDIGCCAGCAATSLNLDPTSVAADHEGNVYITDIVHGVIQKLDKNGIIRNFAGNCTNGFAGDGGPAVNAELRSPTAVCIDYKGNVIVADKGNGRVRKIWLSGTAVPPPPPKQPFSFTVYSNPVTQKDLTFTIHADTNENGQIRIMDVLGKVVVTASCFTNEMTSVPLEIPAGVYIVSAKTNSGKTAITKIIVE